MQLRFISILLWLASVLPFNIAMAQVVAPSRGGEVQVVLATANTLELSFGTMGTGQGRVVGVVASPNGNPMSLAADNGHFYTANATYGQGDAIGKGYTVYNGTGHSVIVTGLKPGTSYYIAESEYNIDSTSIIYNTYGTSLLTTTGKAALATSPLPVELTSFTGIVDSHGKATLNWATASERNTAYFTLERSDNGSSFTDVGSVVAAGASNRALNYKWLDPSNLLQTTYYRLRQVDIDGTAMLSAIVTLVPAPVTIKQIDVYPNPTTGQTVQVNLQGFEGENLTLQVTDALGRPVMAQVIKPIATHYNSTLNLPAELARGTYLLRVNSSSGSIQKRIVVNY